MTALTKLQKARLAQLARRAYDHAGRTAAEPLPDFDAWRRQEVCKACGKGGLTDCTQQDFNMVAAHCHSILCEDGIAMNEILRAGTERRRQMEFSLLVALKSAGLAQTYAETISQARFKCSVMDCNDAQFLALLVTVKSRAKAKRQTMEATAA